MKIYNTRPPNYAAILAVFPSAARDGVIFAYAPDIYAPGNPNLHPALVAHEAVHVERQEKIGVEAWWAQYLVDAEFRYNEELLAHRAEYETLIKGNPSRHIRRAALKMVGDRLAAQLYGGLRTRKQAMADILGES